MHLAHYLGLLHKSQTNLADAFREVGQAHLDEPDVFHIDRLAEQCDQHAQDLWPFAQRYSEDEAAGRARPAALELFRGPRSGGLALLRDLHDLYLMAAECDMAWTLVGQAAQGIRDRELFDVVQRYEGETATQMRWLRTRMKHAAPQAVIVAD